MSLSGNAAPKSIMVFGDSLSAAYGIEIGQGWVALVQDKLKVEYPNYSMINESISGDTTTGGLSRLDAALAEHKPAMVILELGANDGLRGFPPASIKNNLAAMIRKIRASGAEVLLLSMRIPPNYGKRYTEAFYRIYSDLAKEFKIKYVPFILEDIALVDELMQADGLHPNAQAQPKIVDSVWPHLATLLN